MALTKRSESNTVFLQAKHYCLWQELKSPRNVLELRDIAGASEER